MILFCIVFALGTLSMCSLVYKLNTRDYNPTLLSDVLNIIFYVVMNVVIIHNLILES